MGRHRNITLNLCTVHGCVEKYITESMNEFADEEPDRNRRNEPQSCLSGQRLLLGELAFLKLPGFILHGAKPRCVCRSPGMHLTFLKLDFFSHLRYHKDTGNRRDHRTNPLSIMSAAPNADYEYA